MGVFKVSIDKPGGVDLTEIAQLTREISRALDEHDPISGRFTLEVSSPGLERPLRTPAHFARSIGTSVKIKLLPNVDTARRFEGVILSADESAVVIRDPSDRERRVPYDHIEKARTVFAWGPTPRPGGAAKTKKQVADSPAASTERPASVDAVKVVNA